MNEASKHGPNMMKLIGRFIAREAIPPGGGIADGLEFFTNPERRKKVTEKAEFDAVIAIRAIKAAPDNPYRNDDEEIAAMLLAKIKEKRDERGT